jgi:hypothetical protein
MHLIQHKKTKKSVTVYEWNNNLHTSLSSNIYTKKRTQIMSKLVFIISL